MKNDLKNRLLDFETLKELLGCIHRAQHERNGIIQGKPIEPKAAACRSMAHLKRAEALIWKRLWPFVVDAALSGANGSGASSRIQSK
jgi:hypothetical protein